MAARLDKITTNITGPSKVVNSDFMVNFNRHPETDQLVRLVNSEAIKRSVRSLVLTQKRERMFQPNLGCNIQQLLFEPMTQETAAVLKDTILETIRTYEKRALDPDIVVVADDFNNAYSVYIVFSVSNNSDPVNISINLNRVR